ncbi:MAG: hypothetical protein IJ348_04595 [Alistipes sp.]|nr:hypothetical protein [Alistipes sp.]
MTVLVSAVGVLSAVEAQAQQDASINAYSPYTMYGIGELGTHGNAVNRTMGGVGVAWRSSQMASLLNPAGYSATLRKSFILDVGAEGYFLQNVQNKYDAEGNYLRRAKNAKNTVNFREVAIQFPLAKGLGFGLSLAPYGSVGYNMTSTEQSDDTWAEIGSVQYIYQGTGDLTEVKAGIGWEAFKGFSIGVAAKYYWGNIQRGYSATATNDYVGEGVTNTVAGLDSYAISNFKFQVGVQYSVIKSEKRILTLGATYDYGGSLRPKITKTITTNASTQVTVINREESSEMAVPHTVNAGVMYQDAKFTTGFDYEYRNWGSDNNFSERAYGGMEVKYENTHTYKFGFEYTPNRFDVRNYMRRISYRIGARYGDYYQSFGGKRIDQWAVTAGFGFPLRFMGATGINVGVEVGGRGTLSPVQHTGDTGVVTKVGLIRQNYAKVTLGFSLFGEDYWFVRPKID